MKTAEDILEKHLLPMIERTKNSYASIEEMKAIPEWNVVINAMEEYAQQQVKLFATPDVSVAVCDHVWRDMHRSGDVCCDKCGISKYDLQQTER